MAIILRKKVLHYRKYVILSASQLIFPIFRTLYVSEYRLEIRVFGMLSVDATR